MIRLMASVLIVLCTIGGPLLSVQAQTATPSQEEIQALTKEREKTHEDLENVDKSATHLEQSVVIMLGVATLVIAILFGTTILGEIRINQAIKNLEVEATGVKERFPRLAAMETQARSALRDIEMTFGTAGAEDWLEDRYANLEIRSRQRILTVEHLIALEFAGRSTAPQLRGMANFYSSKYKAERIASDLDRSLYYALLAAERGKRKFQYLNDLGFIYMALAEKDSRYWDEAIIALNESKAKHPPQQRCYYNLGVILFTRALKMKDPGQLKEYFGLLEHVKELLETALANTNWEIQPSPELSSLIHYNLACCLCRLNEREPRIDSQSHHLDEAIKHLHRASRFKQTRLETVTGDFTEPNGDLCILARNRFYAELVQDARNNFEQNWT